MSSTGEIKDAVRLAQQYNIHIYKILINGLVNSSLKVSELRVELEEYNRSSMKFFDRLYQIRDAKIPFACVREEQIRVFRDQVKRNDKLRQVVHSIQRNLWNMREMGQRVPLANKHLIEQGYPELCVKNRSDKVPLTVLCDQVIRKYNLRHERHIIALLTWAEEESNSRKATNPVPKRVLQRNQIYPTPKPTITQDQLTLRYLESGYEITPVNSNEDISKDSADGFAITLDDIRELDFKYQTKKRANTTCASTINRSDLNKVKFNPDRYTVNNTTHKIVVEPSRHKPDIPSTFDIPLRETTKATNVSFNTTALCKENIHINFNRPYPLFSWEELMLGFKRSSKVQLSENISQPGKIEAVAESKEIYTGGLGYTDTRNSSDLSLMSDQSKTQSLSVTTESRPCDEIKNLSNQPISQKSQHVFVSTERKYYDKTSNLSGTTHTPKTQGLPIKTERRHCYEIKNLPIQPNTQKSQGVPVNTERRHCDSIKNLPIQPNTQKSQGEPLNTERRHCDSIKNLPYQPNTQKSQGLSITTESKHCDGIKSLTTEQMMGPPVVAKSEIQKSQNTIKPVHPLVGSDRPHVYENKIKRTQHALKRTMTERMTCTEADQLKKRREEQLRALELKKERMKELLSQQFCKTRRIKSSIHYYKVQDNVPKVGNVSKKSVTLPQGYRTGVAKVTKDTSLDSRKRKASPSELLPQSKRSKQEPGIVLRIVKKSSDWNVKQVFDRD